MTLDFATTPSIIQLTLTSWLIGLAIGQVIAGPLSISMAEQDLLFSV